MYGIRWEEVSMEVLLRAFAKNYRLYAKILAAIVLFSCAMGFYLHKNAGGADEETILISDAAAEARAGEMPASNAGDDAAAAQADAAETENAAVSETPAIEVAPATIVVDVGGAVQNPTVLILPAGSRVYEALESAGGLLPQADIREINKATVLQDGDRIYIPSKDESAAKTPVPRSAGGGAGPGVTNVATPSGTGNGTEALIDINTADATELQKLSGVGPSTAQKILDYRETQGRFTRIEDIKNVSGIGDKTFEKLKDKITVD
jgi:competence protein ComEA